MNLTALRCILLGLLTLLPHLASSQPKPPREVPPVELPQARVNAVDTSEFPKVRVLATVLDPAGRPVQLKAIKKLSVVDGKVKARPPYAGFALGAPLDGRKDLSLKGLDKTGIPTAIVVVAAGYQDDALRRGSLGRRLKEALLTGFKAVGKTDRLNLIWYNDRVYRYVGLKGKTGQLTDIETYRKECALARTEALSGGPITLGGKTEKPFAPGTDLCGLQTDPKPIVDLIKGDLTAFEGYFPRLFNLGQPFYQVTRYCKPPRESLKGYEFTPESMKAKLDERADLKLRGEPLDYETSAFDEAMRLLLQDARSGEQKAIVIVSDGRDGYFRDLQLCQENPPRQCLDIDPRQKAKIEACIGDFLKARLIQQQGDFKQRAAHWIGVARAANIRVFAVGLGMLGKGFELERLRLLAERTGGTYRQAETEENLAGEVASTMAEVTGQLAIEFVHQTPEEAGTELAVKVAVELDPTMVRGDVHKLLSAMVISPIAEAPTGKMKAEKAVRGVAVSLQEALGYKTYVVAGIAALVVIGLIALLVTFLVLRFIVRKVRG